MLCILMLVYYTYALLICLRAIGVLHHIQTVIVLDLSPNEGIMDVAVNILPIMLGLYDW